MIASCGHEELLESSFSFPSNVFLYSMQFESNIDERRKIDELISRYRNGDVSAQIDLYHILNASKGLYISACAVGTRTMISKFKLYDSIFAIAFSITLRSYIPGSGDAKSYLATVFKNEAIKECKEHSNDFNVLSLDSSMRGEDGEEGHSFQEIFSSGKEESPAYYFEYLELADKLKKSGFELDEVSLRIIKAQEAGFTEEQIRFFEGMSDKESPRYIVSRAIKKALTAMGIKTLKRPKKEKESSPSKGK